MGEKDELFESTLTSEEIYKGTLLHIFKDQVRLPNGDESAREYFVHNGAVAIVALTSDNKIIMERQFRYPMHKVITEIPAGKVDGPEEDRLDAAKRELLEETGITADNWQNIGDYYPSVAYTTERITLYLATGLHYGDRNLDEDEFLNVFEMPLEEAYKKVMDGEIADGKSIIAILKTILLLNK